MKLRHLLFFLLALSFFACEEIPPTVTGIGDGPTGPPPPDDLENQVQNVLIEEFTGVFCVQCPAGSALIEELLVQHGHQLVAVAIHSGDLSIPYPDSKYDFTIPEGDDILELLRPGFGQPEAAVNRRKFEGEGRVLLGTPNWPGKVAEAKLAEPKVKMALESSYDQNSREVKIKVGMLVTENIPEETHLSIMFTESGIVDLQKVPDMSGPDPNYVHKHVLRDMATNSSGDIITDDLVAGAFIEKEYSYTVPEEWVVENCNVVAFVHSGSEDKDVYQVVETHMTE